MNDEDSERDNLYARAEKISAELGIMTLELKSCIDNVNSRASGHGAASNPLSKIVHILNNQLQALSNVDDNSEQVTKRLEQLTGTCIGSGSQQVHHVPRHVASHAIASPALCHFACKNTQSAVQDSVHKSHLEYLMQPYVCCTQYTVYLEAMNSADVMLQGAQ